MTSSEPAEAPAVADLPDAPATGVPRVDAVLATVADVERRPVADRVEVFERAHRELRRALDRPTDDEPDDDSDDDFHNGPHSGTAPGATAGPA